MSYSLPATTKTRKVNSLPGDLRKIADELIANKFKIEEEMTFDTDYPFLRANEHKVHIIQHDGLYPPLAYRGESMRADLDSVYQLIQQARIQTGIVHPRGKMQLTMGRGEFDDIMHNYLAKDVVKFNPIRIFDVDVALVGGRTNRITLEAWR